MPACVIPTVTKTMENTPPISNYEAEQTAGDNISTCRIEDPNHRMGSDMVAKSMVASREDDSTNPVTCKTITHDVEASLLNLTIQSKLDMIVNEMTRVSERLEGIETSLKSATSGQMSVQPRTRTTSISSEVIESRSLQEAAESKQWIPGVVRSWIGERGFGFIQINNRDVFTHISTVDGETSNLVGARVFVKVVKDDVKCIGAFKATSVRREARHFEITAQEKAEALASKAVEAAKDAKVAIEIAGDIKLLNPPGLAASNTASATKMMATLFSCGVCGGTVGGIYPCKCPSTFLSTTNPVIQGKNPSKADPFQHKDSWGGEKVQKQHQPSMFGAGVGAAGSGTVQETKPEEGREINREANVEWPKPSSSTLNPRDEYIAAFDRLFAQSLAPKTTEVGNAKSISTQQLAQVAPKMLSIKPSVEVQVGQAIIFQAEVKDGVITEDQGNPSMRGGHLTWNKVHKIYNSTRDFKTAELVLRQQGSEPPVLIVTETNWKRMESHQILEHTIRADDKFHQPGYLSQELDLKTPFGIQGLYSELAPGGLRTERAAHPRSKWFILSTERGNLKPCLH